MAHSEETARRILDDIVAGCSVEKACNNHGVDDSAVYRWANGQHAPYDGFCEDYARAMEIRADRMAEEIIAIADESGFDARIVDGRAVVDGDAIQRAALRISTRKWHMEHCRPKKYGSAMTLKGDKDNPLFDGKTEAEIESRLAELIGKAGAAVALGAQEATESEE